MSILNLFLISLFGLLCSIYSINIQKYSDKMKLDVTQAFEVKGGCLEIIIPNNYKRLILGLESINLDRVLLTDQRIESCGEAREIAKCCNRNSTFCLENVNPTENDFRLNYCIDHTYLYACVINNNSNSNSNSSSQLRILEEVSVNNETVVVVKSNDTTNSENVTNVMANNTSSNVTVNNSNATTNPNSTNPNSTNPNSTNPNSTNPNSTNTTPEQKIGSISIKSSVVKGKGCQTTEFVSETECSSIGLISCKDPQKCLPKCSYVECRTDLNDPVSKVFAMCLPSDLSDSEMVNRCRNHITFYEPPSTPQVFKKNCEKTEDEFVPRESSHSFFKFLLVVFGVLVLATFIASVYYRFKVSMDGVPPFDPPSFVPNFIFPRAYPYY